jgi:hypothetical protein
MLNRDFTSNEHDVVFFLQVIECQGFESILALQKHDILMNFVLE